MVERTVISRTNAYFPLPYGVGGVIKDCARGVVLLKLTTRTRRHEASRGLSATAGLLVLLCTSRTRVVWAFAK